MRYLSYALCFLGGLFYALGFPSFIAESLFITPIIGAGLFLFFLDKETKLKKQFLLFLSFALGQTLMGYYWIPKTLIVFGEIPVPIAYFLGIFFAVIVFPNFMVYTLLKNQIENRIKPLGSFYGFNFPIIFKAFLLTFLEAFVPQQFPGHLGHSWIGLGEYLGVASVWGAAGFSFFSYLLILSFIEFYKTRKKFIFIWTTILLFIIANPLFSISQRKAQSKQGQSTRELAVRISQANIGNYLKLESEKGDLNSVDKVMEYFFKLAKAPYEAGDTKKPDIIIWSETSYPYAISSELLKKRRTVAPEIFKQIIFETGAEFLTGGYDQKSQRSWFEREYNSAFFFGNNGELKDVFHKMMLIPFGETLPFGPLNETISEIVPNIAFFSKGKRFTQFKNKDDIRFITPICYELLYTDFIRNYLNANEGNDLIINLTNDSWYEQPEPRQHLFLTRWRALEFAIPVIRSTNTGITTLIKTNGQFDNDTTLGRNKRDNLDFKLEFHTKREPTLYQQYGFWGMWPLFFLMTFISWIISRKRNQP